MLSSRYLHLHEALGLGPMWLKQGAKVLPADHSAEVRPDSGGKVATMATAEPHIAATGKAPARLAAIAAVHQKEKVSDSLNKQSAEQTPQPIAEQPRPSEKAAVEPAAIKAETATAEPVFDTADIASADVMVVSICPAPEDRTAGVLFSGSVGVLLDNMLAAVGLKPDDVHKTTWIKETTVFMPQPTPEQAAAALPQISAELTASQAEVVLFLGQVFEQPDYAETIAQLCGNTPYFVVPHPARLLRQPQLKRQAWQELKKLQHVLKTR
ncbi:uracil-DNA glycosylase family protein [Neisseria montereyensis]|uniref:Uracil-DNA glycosylase n=1 Tax=Neisseria montereyensis TaxID=2973938 RepID=A0ABT2FEC8_9NEIS|nr:uracil-DNA glycosylase family protein [Neisseria montereyensis]MCS4534564.1 uracil-DNA glycosylase [Neisseria montereyensis]